MHAYVCAGAYARMKSGEPLTHAQERGPVSARGPKTSGILAYIIYTKYSQNSLSGYL